MVGIAHDAAARVENDPLAMENGCKSSIDRTLPIADAGEAVDGAGGEVNAQIARSIVAAYRVAYGRGPARARAMFRDDVVVVVLEDVLTPAERSLIAGGRADDALAMRRSLHAAMRPSLERAVADATGCGVRAAMGDTHDDPDVAVEIFLLDRPLDPSRSVAPSR
jgi:uncharacterized protein YbcI